MGLSKFRAPTAAGDTHFLAGVVERHRFPIVRPMVRDGMATLLAVPGRDGFNVMGHRGESLLVL